MVSVAVNGGTAVTPRPGVVIAAKTIMGLVGTSKRHNTDTVMGMESYFALNVKMIGSNYFNILELILNDNIC